MLLKSLFVSALEDALNRYIFLDPDASDLLKPLLSKVIAVKMTSPAFEIYLCPGETGIQLLQEYQGRPDATLSGSPMALCLMGMSESPLCALFPGEVKMEGDVTTGRRFQSFLERLDVDPEEPLSRFTGDVIAHRIGNLVRGGRQWGRESLETLRLNLTEYLQEEARDLPAPAEAEIFYGGVETLRAAGDRLEARVQRLKNALAQSG